MKRWTRALLALVLLCGGTSIASAQTGALLVPSPMCVPEDGEILVYDADEDTWECVDASTFLSGIVQPLTDSTAIVKDNSDATKLLAFQLSGLTTATTRTWTIPDADLTIPATIAALQAAQTFTGLQSFDDGLAADTVGELTAGAGVTIDSVLVKDGKIGLGTDTPEGAVTIVGTAAELTITQTNDDEHGARLILSSSRAGAAVQDGDTLWNISGRGYDGSAFTTSARIVAQADGTISAGDVPGRLLFGTTPSGGAIAERLRIDSNGVSTFTRSGLGTTSANGVVIVNATDAADGAQQYSPRLVLQGEGWKTTATAASQTVAFASEVRPVQGTSAPTGVWALAASINGGAYGDVLRVTSAGQVQHITGTTASPALSFLDDTDKGFDHISNNVLGYFTGGVERFRYSDGNYYLTGIIGFGVTSGVPTATIARVANGAFAIGNITTGVRLNAGTDGTLAVQNFAGSAGATVSMATLSVIGASGFTVTNASSTTALFSGQVSAPGFVTSSAGAAYSWTGRSQLTSPADGTVLARNAAGTDRSVVQGKYFEAGVSAGLTASTTQAQGQGALTNQINEVATCANANDTVTLPAAVAGRTVTIIHNGAETLQIFPASGDDLGAGVNTATTLVAGGIVTFIAYDDTNWKEQ